MNITAEFTAICLPIRSTSNRPFIEDRSLVVVVLNASIVMKADLRKTSSNRWISPLLATIQCTIHEYGLGNYIDDPFRISKDYFPGYVSLGCCGFDVLKA